MNLINSNHVDLVLASAETLRNDVCRALQQYRTERDVQKRISERFKDEDGYFLGEQAKLSAIARDAIAKAERVFCHKVLEYVTKMEDELKRHLAEPVNSQFREKISMLANFKIKPERIEIDDLITLNNGNQLGLTALAKTLEMVDSPYVLHYHTTADYQNDLATIRGLTRNLKYVPLEYVTEGCEIYQGVSADYTYPDGSVLAGGITYNSVSLIANRADFESGIETIKGFKDVWAADCSYSDKADGTKA